MAINFVRNDTAPQLKLTLKDSLLPDLALNLTGAVVKLHIRSAVSGTFALTKTATIPTPADAAAGIAYIDWVDGDLAMAAGNYEAEVEVYYAGNNFRQTVYDFISLTVREQIA